MSMREILYDIIEAEERRFWMATLEVDEAKIKDMDSHIEELKRKIGAK